MARRLKVNVLVAAPAGSGQGSAVFGPDDTEIPDWALEQIGDHAWDGGDSSDDEEKPASKKAAAKRSSSSK